MATLFTELALIMVVTFVIALIMSRLKQPLLIGYIITGVVVGPIFLNFLSEPQSYEVFSHIGVALLLFIVGLQLNPKLIKEVGYISVITGIGQILFTTLFGILLNRILGFGWIPAILIAVALTFSSTIIIVKLLADNRGLEQLYGKISLGFLLVQDMVAVIILMIVGTLSEGVNNTSAIIQTVFLGVLITIAIYLVGKYVLSNVLRKISPLKELLLLFTIAWCFGVAVGYEAIGFSLEIGALVAGITIASTQYQQDITSKIKPLKDFFIILFFIFLGTQFIPVDAIVATGSIWSQVAASIGPILPQAIILSLFVLIGNPLIVLILVTFFGYSAKTGFLSGLTVSQISEFSIILVLLGNQAGFLTTTHVSLITLVALITITSSTYLVVYGEKLYKFFEPFFKKLEKKKIKDSLQGIQGQKHQIGIFGFRRMGPHVFRAISKLKLSCLIVDHDPNVINKLKKKNIPALFGDASNVEFLSEFDFKDMNFVISTINDYHTNLEILENYKIKNPKGIIILTADEKEEAIEFYKRGADYIIEPHHVGGKHIENLIKEYSKDKKRFIDERTIHLDELNKN